MRNIYIIIIFLVTQIHSVAQNSILFPYFLNLETATPERVSLIGPDQIPVNYGLILTRPIQNERGAFVLDDVILNASNGFVVEFEYTMHGYTQTGASADGLALFLYDGSTSNEDLLGGFGGALGYSYWRRTPGDSIQYGLNNGYLAVGLDYYGNFKTNGIRNI